MMKLIFTLVCYWLLVLKSRARTTWLKKHRILNGDGVDTLSESKALASLRRLDGDRFRPDKGGDCSNPSNDPPCTPSTDIPGPNFPPNGGQGGDNNGTIFSNKVKISLWVALSPSRPSLGNQFSFVFTDLFRKNYDEGIIYFHRRKRNEDTIRQDRTPQNVRYEAWYHRTDSALVVEKEQVWWWRYNITYEFYEMESGDPIQDVSLLQVFQKQMSSILQQGVGSGKIMERINDAIDGPDIWAVALGATAPVDLNDFPSGKIDGVENLDDQEEGFRGQGAPREYVEPIDPSEWTIQRYLGLALLVFTVVGSVVSTQVAGYLLRRQKTMEDWSNLNTQEGIDSVLMTGWKIDGDKMEVFRKKNLGYNDDDSVLQGGFERRETTDADMTVSSPEVPSKT